MAIVFINGTVVVDSHSETALEDVRLFLETAPKIVSEELDCEFFLNQPSGYNVYDGEDEYQTLVIITLHGRLRYVTVDSVSAEYEAFFKALESSFWVDFHNVEIIDCYRTEVRRFNSVSEY